MTFSTSEQAAAPRRRPRLDSRVTERLVIGLSLTPAFIITLIGTFIFLGWTVLMSMTDSTLFPSTDFVGLEGYWQIWKYPRWQVAAGNLFTFGPIYMLVCGVIGIGMAIAIDQNVRGENIFRAIYLYPMAVSFVVAGTIWRWILNPGTGVEALVQGMGFESFVFDWITRKDRAIYTVIIAQVWQHAGFVMALVLAGLRTVNRDIINAAMIDGAPTHTIYRRVILPSIAPIFVAVFFILSQWALKTYDIILALTGGGPGIATDVPSIFVRDMMFNRGEIALASVASVYMLLLLFTLMAIYKSYQVIARRRTKQ
ncbi:MULTISPECIES: carbohydrate ABC transporter permease [Marinovum]|jgi:glucose/mannose transport system permease protein|uniref:Carbohydrate ABC transporter membrane protein 1, CUT1 family n=1 Tax=Marinovum algicola TaxID=42444 RepID=A0A975ZPJ8_9RHOB|nr:MULTISPECIES: sugar ABC transporter permease [Marinovum]MDD9739862.1 sugar ABC transporter permease [Marinovum sp. SP66]MDD9746794.1 sugar ABC transporter permease [Marinovum sp. PR37]SEJ89775.1 carbohydrate ABC transporter membrane protein 1, CUT1 family [Marinovum algicola]SLN45301.1 Trehalose transport system permease protein SugA [Marinovum algicola]